MAGNIDGRTDLSNLSLAGGLWVGSAMSVSGFTQPVMSSISSTVAPFVVQGSASSFTIIVWAGVLPGDQILVTPLIGATVSSMSSGLVAHSHCTLAGQIEFRLSNVSTLAQNQSTRVWSFTKITPLY